MSLGTKTLSFGNVSGAKIHNSILEYENHKLLSYEVLKFHSKKYENEALKKNKLTSSSKELLEKILLNFDDESLNIKSQKQSLSSFLPMASLCFSLRNVLIDSIICNLEKMDS